MKPDDLQKWVRREQSHRELEKMGLDIRAWLEHRRGADKDKNGLYVGRHKTQLEAIESALGDAVTALCKALQGMDLGLPLDRFYDECRNYDQAAVWLRHVWEYYQAKFDQRDDLPYHRAKSDQDQEPPGGRVSSLLRAADEVVWSCYRQVFARAEQRQPELKGKRRPAPLAFIEPEYSPAALESDKQLRTQVPLEVELRSLDDFLQTLPIPLLRLPPWCVGAPWWLVYVGHEVGHHVQHDLDLIGGFRQGMEAAARAQQLPKDEVTLWGNWGEEIFADVFSLMMMGSWALWALVEEEWGPVAKMVKRRGKYPSPVIRLTLMARVLDRLRKEGKWRTGSTEALHGLDLEDVTRRARADPRLAGHVEALDRDSKVVAGAVDFALGPLSEKLGTLWELCTPEPEGIQTGEESAEPGPEDKVERWARFLRGQTVMANDRQLETARQVTCGSLCAWAALSREVTDDSARAEQRTALAIRTKQTVGESGPSGTRAGFTPSGMVPGKGEELKQLLLDASRRFRNAEQP